MRAIHNPDAAIKRTHLDAKIRDPETDATAPEPAYRRKVGQNRPKPFDY
jgi:hypothetical protein